MSLTHYDPFNLVPSFRAFEDTINRFFAEPSSARPWTPAVDIVEGENELVLKADLPDLRLEDIEVRVENDTLTIRGERKFKKEENAKGYHRIERSYGAFLRSFSLPPEVEADKVGAEYKNGVLTVTLPKKESAKPRQVKVNIKAE